MLLDLTPWLPHGFLVYVLIAIAYVKVGQVLHVEFEAAQLFKIIFQKF